jgi:hypothetical protein
MPSWFGKVPIYINNFNWLTSTKEMTSYFDDIPGVQVVIVDNESTYPPLLDWYASCPCQVVRLPGNFGEHAPWNCGVVLSPEAHRTFWGSDFYVVTDSDLSLGTCPKDLIEVLVEGSRAYPHLNKVALSLEIDDLPDESPAAVHVRQWESQFWRERQDARFFKAAVDTTFALYSIDVPFGTAQSQDGNSIRSDRPYTARHLPWYITFEKLTPEEEFYLETTRCGHWGRFLQSEMRQRSR